MISDQIKTGVDRAPHRSLLYALGLTEEEMARPLIAVVSAKSDIIPGHIHLDKIAEAVKAGIYAAGGTPVVVPAIGVCDGIVMGHKGMHYSLASRELIADSVETLLTAHCFDGAVLIPNCDKIVPGMLMGAIRVNIPALVCSGGPMLAGHVNGKKTSLSQMFEAVGAYQAGKLDDAGLRKCEQSSCPSCGSCSGMFTANSMNCLCEALGMALPGNGSIPAPVSARIQFAKHSGVKVMELVKKNIRPRDIVTADAFHNAITVDMALEQGKDVFAVPGRITDTCSRGCNRLIGNGAGIAVSVAQLLQELQGSVPHAGRDETFSLAQAERPNAAKAAGVIADKMLCPVTDALSSTASSSWPPLRKTIWQALDTMPQSMDEIADTLARQKISINVQMLMQELVFLELEGAAGSVMGRYYRKTFACNDG